MHIRARELQTVSVKPKRKLEQESQAAASKFDGLEINFPETLGEQAAKRVEASRFLADVKAGSSVIVKYSGVIGHESSPRPVRKVDGTWIFVDGEKYSRKTGRAPAQVYEEENEDMEKVRKVERYPARIVRVATVEDMAAQQAKEEADRQSRAEIHALRSRLESLAQFFPEGFRPNVEQSWGANKENFRLEFEDLTEEQVKKLAALIQASRGH